MKKTLQGIQGILFDMDGTLVNSVQAVENAWRAWAHMHGLDPEMVVKTAHGRPARDSIALLAPESDQLAQADWVLQRELREPGVVAIPGIADFLKALGDFPWGIVTSANRSLALYRLKLAGLPVPSILITVEDIQQGKPHPEGYLLGAKRLGLTAEQCLVVEDTPAGLEAGRRAGMRLMGITTTFSPNDLAAEVLIQDYRSIQLQRENDRLLLTIHE